MKHTKKTFQLLSLLLLIATISITFFIEQTRPSAASAFLHVSGTQIIDASGKSIVLRGSQIETSFMYANSWQNNNDVTSKLNPTAFNQMTRNWHMNVLRLSLSNWIYNSDPTHYLNLLDQVVQEANTAGLYVILNLHDDKKSGSPYGDGASVPKPETIAFWKTIAAHFASNTMLMFEAFNEPAYPDANTWLNGGGTVTGSTGKSAPIVGMQAVVNAIRSTGAPQIIVIAGVATAITGNHFIQDPNIIYTRHVFQQVVSGNPTAWDALWGPLKGVYPLDFGEWALEPNSNLAIRCKGATMANADQIVTNFLNYMDANNISWTAWQFDTYYLIQDHTNFTPTRLDDPNNPWTCPSPNSTAGMGAVVQKHLLSL
ncbi:MAG TPA: cellulase family glycosylhydrolase [Ktedonobacteraceae bacterium]|nr:cellulase family glycosylhydrolase [Ktedonobacteraceae bacterium]